MTVTTTAFFLRKRLLYQSRLFGTQDPIKRRQVTSKIIKEKLFLFLKSKKPVSAMRKTRLDSVTQSDFNGRVGTAELEKRSRILQDGLTKDRLIHYLKLLLSKINLRDPNNALRVCNEKSRVRSRWRSDNECFLSNFIECFLARRDKFRAVG